jgi:tRNA (cytidine/uridine-2'-O-)-methyltransferase
VFGKETKGLDPAILEAHQDTLIRIPMLPDVRSLNLANSVAIVLYEGLRQLDFPGLK